MRREKPLPEDFDDILVAEQNTRTAGEGAAVGGVVGLAIALAAMCLARLSRRKRKR